MSKEFQIKSTVSARQCSLSDTVVKRAWRMIIQAILAIRWFWNRLVQETLSLYLYESCTLGNDTSFSISYLDQLFLIIGVGAAGATYRWTKVCTMVVQESQDTKLTHSDSVSPSQQNRSNTSLSQFSGNSQHFTSNENIYYEPEEYTETDFLLPNQLYGRSRLTRSPQPKDANVSGALEESICSMVVQILVPFLLAGLGTVSAGILLDIAQVRNRTLQCLKLFSLHKYFAICILFICFLGRAGRCSKKSQRS